MGPSTAMKRGARLLEPVVGVTHWATLFAQGGRIMPALIAGLLISLTMSAGAVPAAFMIVVPLAGPFLAGIVLWGWAMFIWAATCLTLYFDGIQIRLSPKHEPARPRRCCEDAATGGREGSYRNGYQRSL